MKMMLIFIMVIMIGCGIALAQENEWEYAGLGIKEREVRAIAIDPADEKNIYAGTDRAVYRSEDGGKNWCEVLALKGTYKSVNAIAIDPKDSNIVYVSTENGVFKTADLAKNWKKVFDGKGDFERDVKYVAIDPQDGNSIYIATGAGVFASNDAGNSWQRSTSLKDTAVNHIAVRHMSPTILFAGATTGVFSSKDNGATWERIFVSSGIAQEDAEETDSAEYDADEIAASVSGVNCITFDPVENRKVYLGTADGVYLSADDGASYRKLSGAGLMNERINNLLVTKGGRLYAATNGGVFEYYPADERWEELYKGKAKAVSRSITYSEKENALWGAFDVGLFKAHLQGSSAKSKVDGARRKLLAQLKNEPSIQQVQKVAIRYADCEPGKITLWRVGAQARAFMPKVSFGVDRDKGSNIDVDRGGTNDPDRFVEGPWDSSRGWDASVEWDLGDIIWNPAQTSIDVRSRLTAQLRDDIMDDVTRSYFERKRLLIELAQRPPQDIKLREEKELRVEELTANIDGLTGGYFSKEIARRNKEKD